MLGKKTPLKIDTYTLLMAKCPIVTPFDNNNQEIPTNSNFNSAVRLWKVCPLDLLNHKRGRWSNCKVLRLHLEAIIKDTLK